MNRQNYRAAFDAVDFSPDFEERTLQKLAAMRHASEKEQNKMSMNRTKKITLLAAAAVALLAVTVSAAVLWLTPAQVAVELNDPMLAEAFQSEAAVILNETQTVGDYTVTLMGMVSGANISQWCADVQESRTYAVVSVVRTDGTPLTEENYDVVPCGAFTVTPLVSGYDPRAVNVFTLNGACSSFLRDGRAYYVLDTQSLEIFSDHTVYLALYEGFAAPSYERFSLAEDGTVDLRDNVTGCMFTLPLDTHTADPDAARAFVESTGIPWEPMTDAQLAVQEAHEHNLSTFDKLTGRRPDVLAAGFYEGVRAVPADRMPLAGRGWTVAELEGLAFRGVPEARSIPRAPGLWICAGFGSRGLTWGLACARHVAADVTGDVQALPGSLAAKLDPARFLPKLLAG